MSTTSDVKDIAILGLIGYVIYWLAKNQPIKKIEDAVDDVKDKVYDAGVETGKVIGSVTSGAQEDWYKTQFDVQQLFSDPVGFASDVINPKSEREFGAGTKIIGTSLLTTAWPGMSLTTQLLPGNFIPNTSNFISEKVNDIKEWFSDLNPTSLGKWW
jgi:hypothetical protein